MVVRITECLPLDEFRQTEAYKKARQASHPSNFAETSDVACEGVCTSAVGEFSAEIAGGNRSAASNVREEKFVPAHLSEVLLESAIEVAKQRMCESATRAEKMDAWREMCRLIDQRTPSRRRFMERMRGLG